VLALVLRDAGQGARLVERAAIEQPLDALAHGEAAGLVLALDVLGAAHGARQLLAALELFDLGIPAHSSLFTARLVRRTASHRNAM